MLRNHAGIAVVLAAVCCLVVSTGLAQDYLQDDSPPSAYALDGPVLTVQTIPLCPKNRALDGNWQSGLMGSDGNFYFGSSTHSYYDSASFFRYRPGADDVEMLSQDVSADCGEDANTQVPQGKLHSQLVEMDGWVYGSTHLGNYIWDRAAAYTGSHVLGWNMATDQVRDLGVTYGQSYTAYSAIAADPNRNYIYSLVTNWSGGGTRMVRQKVPREIDAKVDHEDPNQWQSWLVSYAGSVAGFAGFLDGQGNMWFNINAGYGSASNAAMYRVDPEGSLTAYSDAVPRRRNPLDDVEDANNQIAGYRYWQWGARVDDDRYVFTMFQDGGLWEFDASKARDGDLSDAFKQINWLGATGLGITLAGDTIYYVANMDPNNLGAKSLDMRLRSVSLEPNSPVIDWGRIEDQAGRTPYRIETMAADDAGHVYFTGDFRIEDPDEREDYRTLRTLLGENEGALVSLNRGQFMGTVTVAEPLTVAIFLAGAGVACWRRGRRR